MIVNGFCKEVSPEPSMELESKGCEWVREAVIGA